MPFDNMMTTNQEYALVELYRNFDQDENYEQQWGYLNPISREYWRLRDQVVFKWVADWLSVGDVNKATIKILEVGTGHAHELSKYALFNLPLPSLVGIDLVFERLKKAKINYPCIGLAQQNGLLLAFANESFDIVFQYTCVVHLLSKVEQKLMCREMVRVLKPGGIIIWWDIASPQWRTVVGRRLSKIFTKKMGKEIIPAITKTFREFIDSNVRQQTLIEAIPDYLLPIDQADILDYFQGLEIVNVTQTGLDYEIWKTIFPRSNMFAEFLWKEGWLSRHYFAIVRKGRL